MILNIFEPNEVVYHELQTIEISHVNLMQKDILKCYKYIMFSMVESAVSYYVFIYWSVFPKLPELK